MRHIEVFIGARIVSIGIDDSKELMRITTDKGDFDFVAVGDCCSISWIEHLNGVSLVIGGVVMDEPDLNPDQTSGEETNDEEDFDKNYVRTYITKISTDRGHLDVEFRNKSNGYYSGWLTLVNDRYGGEIKEIPDLTLVTRDF